MRIKFFENFISLSIIKGFQLLVPLVTLPYLILTLGLSNYGKIAFAQSISIFLGAVIQYGFNLTATRKVSRQKNDWTKLAETFSLTFGAGFFLSLASASILVPILMVFIKDTILFWTCIFSFLTIAFQSLLPIWLFNGMEKLKFIAFVGAVSNICFLIGILTFVTEIGHTVRVPMIQSITSFAALAFTLLIINYSLKIPVNFSTITLNSIMGSLKENRSTFIVQFVPNLYNNASIFLLGVMGGTLDVGIFSAAKRIADACCSLAQIISSTFISELSNNMKYFSTYKNIVLNVGVGVAVIIWILSDILGLFFSSRDSESVSLILKSLTPAVLFYFAMLCYGQTYLIISNNEVIYQNITLVVSICALPVACGLIYFYGAVGAVCTITAARFVISFTSYISYRRLNVPIT
ncbi:MAG: oligosaccharide flippase family protein [Emcibacteraceae bacterium]|nr:oligosaccharide flippase family protein [Emcibacteraceae bacterium]